MGRTFRWCLEYSSYPSFLVIVGDLDVVGVAVGETKADSPLVIDGNRMLPCPLSLERVKPVAWRDLEIIKPSREVDVLQLPPYLFTAFPALKAYLQP